MNIEDGAGILAYDTGRRAGWVWQGAQSHCEGWAWGAGTGADGDRQVAEPA